MIETLENNKLYTLTRWWVILLFIPSIYTGFYPGKITLISFACGWLLIATYLFNIKQFDFSEFDIKPIFIIFLLFNVVVYLRGFFNIDTNADKYALAASLFFLCFLVPSYIFLAQIELLPYIWKSLLVIGGALCVICYLFPSNDGMMSVAHNAAFFNIFLLFTPYLPKKWRNIILFFVIALTLIDIDRRSILVNSLFCVALGLFSNIVTRKVVKTGLFLSLVLGPIFLFILGVSGVFNVFQYFEESYTYQTNESTRDMFVDSRTAIYEDVFSELQDQDAILFGLGGNGKTRTSLADIKHSNFDEIYSHGRSGTESGMLNYIQYGGIIGLIIYSLLLIVGAFRAVFKSNNSLMMLVGLYVAFKFLFSFVEDRIGFQPTSFYIFLAIGMCYNTALRNMDDDEMSEYVMKIFA